jgi:hypothetical protein
MRVQWSFAHVPAAALAAARRDRSEEPQLPL